MARQGEEPRYTGPREGELEAYNAEVDQANERDASWLAKIAIIGFGTHVLGRAVGRNIIADIIHTGGLMSKWAGGLYKRKGKSLLRPEVYNRVARAIDDNSGVSGEVIKRTWEGSNLEEIEGVRRLIEMSSIIGDPKNITSRPRLIEFFKEELARDARVLQRPTPLQKEMSHSLDRLTFGDILENESYFFRPKEIAKSYQIESINLAIDQGLITKETVVGPKLFKRLDKQGKFASLIDLRLTDPRYALESAAKIVGDVAGIFRGFASLFGNARTLAELPSEHPGGPLRVFIKGQADSAVAPRRPTIKGPWNDADVLAFDIETNKAKAINDVTKLHMVSIAAKEKGGAWKSYTFWDDTAVTHPDVVRSGSIQDALDILEAHKGTLFGHKILDFDLPVIKNLRGGLTIESGAEIRDTLEMSHVAFGTFKSGKLREIDRLAAIGKEQEFSGQVLHKIPSEMRGRHSLEAWGQRLGKTAKLEYKGDW